MKTSRWLLFAFVFLCSVAQGFGQATYCVRAGATGSNNGSDWNNAYSALPSSLVRGATYYIADGSYAGYTFDDVESGSTVITIKKATAADHGPEAGWNAGYGDGQAAFNGDFIMQRDFYVIDGQKRNENQWNDDASYGFRVRSVYGQNLSFPPGGDTIVVQYASVGGNYSETYYSGMSEAIYCGGFAGSFHHWTIRRCFLHNSTKTIVQFAGVNDMVIEYCLIGPGWGKEAIRGQINCYNTVIRHNVFYNASQTDPQDSTSGITAEIAIWDGSNFNNNQIYGNAFTNSKFGGRNGVIIVGGNGSSWVGPGTTGTKVHNNTFAGIAERAVFGEVLVNGSSNEAKNNLFYNCAGTSVSASSVAANLTATSDPFVNYGTRDLRLTSSSQARNAGVNLGAAFSVDRYGNVRGADGVWDVGAYEHQGTTSPVAPSISAHPSNVSVAEGQSATFSVTAAGTEPLSYQWQRNGANVAGATAASYTINATTSTDNGASFRAVVSNSAGSVTSNAAILTVTMGNPAPTVAITNPTSGATFTAPANIAIAVTASDDVAVSKVEFFNGASKLGESTAAPFSFAWNNVATGQYNITAKATDNLGVSNTSAQVAITVSAPPSSGDLVVGDRVRVNIEPSLRVRSAAQLSATIVGNAPYQELGTVVAGPVTADGYTFYQINYDVSPDGWSILGDSANPWLIRATNPAPKPPTGLRVVP